MTELNAEVAMVAFAKRVEDNKGLEQVDNARLHAGSPMFFYCRKCRVHTVTLPESYTCRPKQSAILVRFLWTMD